MLPLIVRIEETERKTAVTPLVFDTSPVHVGRNPTNEVVVQDKFCSQWHGILRFDEQGITYQDAGSTNGTDFDGRVLGKGERVIVTSSSDLRIGTTRILVSRGTLEQQHASPPKRKEWTRFGIRADELLGKATTPAPAPAPTPATTAKPPPDLSEASTVYAELVARRDTLLRLVREGLLSLPEDQRAPLLSVYQERFPALNEDRAFIDMGRALTGSNSVPDNDGQRLIDTFLRAYLPQSPGLRTSDDVRGFLTRLAEVLETFSSAFVELRRGHGQFAKELGVRSTAPDTELFRAKSAAEVLKYVLDWKTPGSVRTQELMGGFVGIMVHQVALLNGVREGVKALLGRLSPDFVDRQTNAPWPLKANARWKTFQELHQRFMEEEQQLTEVVFGPEFGRAYATVMNDSGSGENT